MAQPVLPITPPPMPPPPPEPTHAKHLWIELNGVNTKLDTLIAQQRLKIKRADLDSTNLVVACVFLFGTLLLTNSAIVGPHCAIIVAAIFLKMK